LWRRHSNPVGYRQVLRRLWTWHQNSGQLPVPGSASNQPPSTTRKPTVPKAMPGSIRWR
jgi:hypothetical protein